MVNLAEILNKTPNLKIEVDTKDLIEFFDYVSRPKQSYKPEDEKMLTTEEACKMAKISRTTLHRWKKAGIIPYVKIGKNVRYKQSDLEELLQTKKGPQR